VNLVLQQLGGAGLILGRCISFVTFFLIFSHSALAHNPPEEYYDRRITVTLEPACVTVNVHVELSQVSLFSLPDRDKKIDVSKVKDRGTLEAAVMARFVKLLPDQILAFLNDQLLTWKVEKTRVDPLDSSHFHIVLRADWQPKPGLNRFELSDKSFPKAPGPYRLTFDFPDDLTPQELPDVKEWTQKGIDPREERNVVIDFEVPSSSLATPASGVAEPEPAPPPPSFWQRLWKDDLSYLLTNNYGLALLMLIALVHGAGHSLMPGHGKTMVAAYLVGERGTPAHAVTLGLVTTLTHTSAAIIVAVLLRFVLPEGSERTVNRVLMFGSGLMMLVVGIWLLLQRLAGRSDHVHLFDMGHAHSHGGEPVAAPREFSTVRLIMLGIAGGLIPCWGAIMWVVGCIATSQFWMALPVVLAFSAGLASVLVALGLTVVYAGRLRQSRIGQYRWVRAIFNDRTVRIMPIVGAVTIVLIGLFFCASSGLTGNR